MTELTELEKTTIQYSQFTLEEWKNIVFGLRLLRNGLTTEKNIQKINDILVKCPSAAQI